MVILTETIPLTSGLTSSCLAGSTLISLQILLLVPVQPQLDCQLLHLHLVLSNGAYKDILMGQGMGHPEMTTASVPSPNSCQGSLSRLPPHLHAGNTQTRSQKLSGFHTPESVSP